MKPIEWTDKHRRVALPRLFELAAEVVAEGRVSADKVVTTLLAYPADGVRDVTSFRLYVATYLGDARADREVRRIDALATADDATRAAIAAERKRHERALRKLTSGRYVVETSERWEARDPINGAVLASRDQRADAAAELQACGLPDVRPHRVRVTHIRRTAR